MVSSTHEHHDLVRRTKFPAPVQKEQVEKDWEPRGFSCSLMTDQPGGQPREFRHTVDELIVPVSGQLEVYIGGDHLVLQPGDEAFVPAGTQLRTANTGDTQAVWAYGYA